MSETSRPYFVTGGTPKYTSYTYDILARVTQETFPDTSQSNFAYHGLTTSVTNALTQTTTMVRNAQGLVASMEDANSKTTSYVYDSFGDLLTTTDPLGNVISNTFDLRGRKTASSDPDMGSWSYVYDVLSELTSQTDAKSQNTMLSYDLLGRPTQRVEASMTSNWVYDTATTGVGQLASACTGTGCTSPTMSSYFRSQTYDSLGRPSVTTLTIGGTNYAYTTAYNSDGRVDTVTYPSGFVAKYVYTSLGYLSEIKDNVSGTVYWTVNTRDAELHLTEGTAGSGVVTSQAFDPNTGRITAIQAGPSNAVANFSYAWDAVGNLSSRTDTIESYSEYFCYDALNRLTNSAAGSTSCTTAGTGFTAKTVGYDALGNISSKTGVGTYSYPASGASSVQPHAVSSVAGTVNGVVNPTYNYDANGNMLCTLASGETCTLGSAARFVTYTSFNMTASIVQGANSDTLTYDSEHNRITEVTTGTNAGTTAYLNDPASGAMSEQLVAGSTSTWKDYIASDNGLLAVRFNTGGTVSVDYVVGDHLGSTSVLTNAGGTVTERDSYDAWGLRRNANGTDASGCTSVTSALTRGFTAQEHLDPTCAINMNARLYDPTLARFMSADPIVSSPFDGQSFNRFSYVENGPLSATDPTGHDSAIAKPTSTTTPLCPSHADAGCDIVVYGNCFGCSGPGAEDQYGKLASVAGVAFAQTNNQLTFAWNGQSQSCTTTADCQYILNQIFSQGSHPLSQLVFYFPQLGASVTNTVTYTGDIGDTSSDASGMEIAPATCGCFSTLSESDTNGGLQYLARFGVGPTYLSQGPLGPLLIANGVVRSGPIFSAPFIVQNIYATRSSHFSVTVSGLSMTGAGTTYVPASISWVLTEQESGNYLGQGAVSIGSINNPITSQLLFTFSSPGYYKFEFGPNPTTGNQDVKVQLYLDANGPHA